MKIIVSLYNHIEGYPPTFNAINILAKKGHTLTVLMRKDLPTSWNYLSNIRFETVGDYQNRFEFEQKSKLYKIREFFIFLRKLFKLIKREKPNVVLLYDNIPLMAYRFIRFFLNKKSHKVWFHNHDIHYLMDYKKYSLPWFAYFSLKKSFTFIHFFSLPAKERLQYFNLKKFRGKQMIIPNFPPAYLYRFQKEYAPKDIIKLVYPGSNISHMHGIEEIIPILNNRVNKKALHLYLVGTIKSNYKKTLLEIAEAHNTTDKVFFVDRMPYIKIQEEMIKYDIGVAINKPMNITYETGGTAANKIYEYPASGLPSIFYDNKHYRTYFDHYDWAFFTDLSEKSLINCIHKIDSNYLAYSKLARKEYIENLSFENVFNKAYSFFLD